MSTKLYAFKAENNDALREQIGVMKFLVKDMHCLESIEIQVFSLPDGWVYRVLEVGYGLRNLMWEHPTVFPQCNYDDRTEIPEEDEKNKWVADLVDQLIVRNEYTIIDIAPKSTKVIHTPCG